MTAREILETITDRLHSSATVKSVYGDPIQVGDRTIIPVARVSYGFGAGAGRGKAEAEEGGGGGGGLSTCPAGVVEVTPQGTRFIATHDPKRMAAVFAAGVLTGMLLARRKHRALIRSEKR